MRPLALIVAQCKGVIGNNGRLPWPRLDCDMRLFAKRTMGHAILMGRKTHDGIGRPLSGRRNIVVSSTLASSAKVEVAPSLDAALELAYQTDEMPFVIGGVSIYQQAMPLVTRLYVTEIEGDYPGDAYFDALDLGPEWVRSSMNKLQGSAGLEPYVWAWEFKREGT